MATGRSGRGRGAPTDTRSCPMAITCCATAITSCASTRRRSYSAPRRPAGSKERPGRRATGSAGPTTSPSTVRAASTSPSRSASNARVVARDIDFANGLALTTDGRWLVVAESYRNRILAVCLDEPGVAAGPPTPFADLPSHPDPEGTAVPDGVAFNAAGRLWVAHYGMQALPRPGGGWHAVGHVRLRYPADKQSVLRGGLDLRHRRRRHPGSGTADAPGRRRARRLTTLDRRALLGELTVVSR